MELQFQKVSLSCLEPAMQEVLNGEQTQEIKLPEAMPDIGRVIAAWGQPILRSKEWRMDTVAFSGGMMVWVLYAPEDGSGERCIDGWIPFQMTWDLPDNLPEGSVRLNLMPRFVDARSVSPRKLMVRAGMAVMAEAMVPKQLALYTPEKVPENVQLLSRRYPVRLPMEAGEKAFVMEEDLVLPTSAPQPEQIVYHTLRPKNGDIKVTANKIVFRGTGEVHVLYRDREGKLAGWNFSVPFSQYAELRGEYSPDALADMVVSPTSMELSLDENGQLHLKAGLVGQYIITDKQILDMIQDAYSTDRDLETVQEPLPAPAVLENRRENLYGEQTIPGDAERIVDARLLTEFPRQRRTESGVELELPGTFQVLYYGEDGILRSGTGRFEGKQTIPADENSQILVMPLGSEDPQTITGNGSILLKGEVPMELTTTSDRGIPMVRGLELGDVRQPDPARPSLILRRAGTGGLWDIAKGTNSTMDAIRRANNLENEPSPGQMLLIPIP